MEISKLIAILPWQLASPTACIPGNPGGSYRAFCDLSLEYRQHQFGYKEPAEFQCVNGRQRHRHKRCLLGIKDLWKLVATILA